MMWFLWYNVGLPIRKNHFYGNFAGLKILS